MPIAEADMVAVWPAGRLERELARFRDHWAAAAGANARKHDWDAAWRNWLRRADDDQPRPKPARPNTARADRPARRRGDPGLEPDIDTVASPLVRAGLARLRDAGGTG